MGLRINTNVNSMTALRNLSITDKAQSKSLERLSTGLRINRASDDPSGLVISEILRSQISGLEQALENSSFASNLVGTADAALTEVSGLLVEIRQSAVFALNTGGTSPDQIAAEQDAVDAALASIDRIAATTRFGDTQLLNGASTITTSAVSAGVGNLNVQSVNLGDQTSRTFEVAVSAAATRGEMHFMLNGGSAAGDQVIRVSGALGTAEILITSGTDTQDVIDSVNAVRGTTGVSAVLSTGALGVPLATDVVSIISEGFGSAETTAITVVSGGSIDVGSAAVANLAAGSSLSLAGTDATVSVGGAQVDVTGNSVSVNGSFLEATFTLDDNIATDQQFTISSSGLTFQLNTEAVATDRITLGLPDVSTSSLGVASYNLGSGAGATAVGGYLSTLKSGGANDLSTDPSNALRVLDAAIADVNELRGYLGAFESDTIESNMNSLSVALENLTASESEIRDLDFSKEVAEYTRAQIMFSAGTSVLATANLIPQNVLTLLA